MRAIKLALPQAPTLRLDIMGRGESVPALKRLAEDLGIADRVRFSDPVPADQIVDFVTHGDVGIIPYHADGFADLVLPTKAYELAWLRRPIIASDTPAIRSMFGPQSIRLCQPEDDAGFAQALADLYHNPDERRRMVVGAADDYEPYRWELMAARYTELLAALAHARGAAYVRAAPRRA
jgi:glycosyltransferase involved in cell wall biosynthesis